MNTPNPLIPQGSLEAPQFKKRSATKIVVSSILAIHGVVLGGLLFLGCKEEPGPDAANGKQSTSTQLADVDRSPGNRGPFGDLGLDTNEIQIPTVAIDTNNPFGSTLTDRERGFAGGGGNNPFPTDPGLAGTNQNGTGFPPVPPDRARGGTSLIEPSIPAVSRKYTVLPNDNFWTIARNHHVTVKAIAAANPNVDPHKLKVGQELNLPANVTPLTPKLPEDGPVAAAGAEKIHVVKSGDTLYDLAKDNNVTVKDLQRANGIVGSNIRVGQKLIIPLPARAGTN